MKRMMRPIEIIRETSQEELESPVLKKSNESRPQPDIEFLNCLTD